MATQTQKYAQKMAKDGFPSNKTDKLQSGDGPGSIEKEESPELSENYLLGIYLVKSGSKGDSLLFRYPYQLEGDESVTVRKKKESSNPFALISEDLNKHHPSCKDGCQCHSGSNSRTTTRSFASICTELDPVTTTTGPFSDSPDQNLVTVVNLPDRVVSNLFAVKVDLCNEKLEIKINNVRFVGYPLQLSARNNSSQRQVEKSMNEPRSKDILAFNIVFALRANASHDVVNSFQKCSKLIAEALNEEEEAKGYLSKESKAMLLCHDEASSPSEDFETSPYAIILQKSQLANDLKKIFQDLKTQGKTHLKINESSDLNLCIQQTVHRLSLRYHRPSPSIGPRELKECFSNLRPYHAMLLLSDPPAILRSIRENEIAIKKVVYAASPTKNLVQVSVDTNLPIGKVCEIVVQLVYWAKATIIYPLSETNVYVINPLAPTSIDCALIEKFSQTFPNDNLLKFLSEFSLGTSIDQLRNPLNNQQQQIQLFNKVIWLLRHRLISQLHTYIHLLPPNSTSPCLTKKALSSYLDDIENRSTAANGSIPANGKINQAKQQLEPLTSPMQSPSIRLFSSFSQQHDQFAVVNNGVSSLSYERSMSVLRELGLGDFERESIYQVPAAKNPQDLNLFAKLCQFFDGKHHIEHIMHSENVRRSQILAIIDKFRSVLITSQHEDKSVFQLCPYLGE